MNQPCTLTVRELMAKLSVFDPGAHVYLYGGPANYEFRWDIREVAPHGKYFPPPSAGGPNDVLIRFEE